MHAAAPENVWKYGDAAGDASEPAPVDVIETRLDTKTAGYYRVRVFGREFIKDETDIVRIFFDTDETDSGPEYRLTWTMGKNPDGLVGRVSLEKADAWWSEGTKVRCEQTRKAVNYSRDVITLQVPRRCVGSPDKIRWAGFVGRIDSVEDGILYGPHDFFPRASAFPGTWVG